LKIFLVRHGKPVKRAVWADKDGLRPLTSRGEDQARGVQATLAGVPIRRICSSRAIRCHETVEPLAADRSLLVELDDRLNEEHDSASAQDLLEEEAESPLLICAGRSQILGLLRAVGIGSDVSGSVQCQKGSIWALELEAGEVIDAEYLPPVAIEASHFDTSRRAVLDIGSASMSLLVADISSGHGSVEPVRRVRAALNFGAARGAIEISECERVAELACDMRDEAESLGSAEVLPVATAGLRNAPNGREVAQRIGTELGLAVRLLSGKEEARLVYSAVRTRLGLGTVPILALDLGGGSLDLAAGHGDRIHYEASEPLGVSRLRADLVRSDPMQNVDSERIRGRVASLLAPHLPMLGKEAPGCFAAGGTVRALARLIQVSRRRSDLESVRGMTLSRGELAALFVKLRSATHDQRMAMPTVSERRADLLPVGAAILVTLLEQLEMESLTVSDWGLREGVLLRAGKTPAS